MTLYDYDHPNQTTKTSTKVDPSKWVRKVHFSSRAAVWRILRVSVPRVPPVPWRSCAMGWHHWRCQGAEELGVLEGPRDPEGGKNKRL